MSNQDEPEASVPRFEFGKNWSNFLDEHYDVQRLERSREKLLQVLDLETLDGLTFLDVGCGSGLHSFAALTGGAERVVSFDYDPFSVEATDRLREMAGNPQNWTTSVGSVLDVDFLATLPSADIVYSWGVLHHTGDVWTALSNTIALVKPGSLLYIALYSADVQINPTPEFWLDVKRRYVSGSIFTRRYLEAWYVWRFEMGKNLSNSKRAWRRIRDPKRERGMDYMTDVRDWLGGWPMEFVWDNEVIDYCKERGLELEKIQTGEACSEFVFRRMQA